MSINAGVASVASRMSSEKVKGIRGGRGPDGSQWHTKVCFWLCSVNLASVTRYDFTSCQDGFCGYAWPHGSQTALWNKTVAGLDVEMPSFHNTWKILKASQLPANPSVFSTYVRGKLRRHVDLMALWPSRYYWSSSHGNSCWNFTATPCKAAWGTRTGCDRRFSPRNCCCIFKNRGSRGFQRWKVHSASLPVWCRHIWEAKYLWSWSSWRRVARVSSCICWFAFWW